jgi:hypothetical protein
MVNLHTDPIPEEVQRYHKRYLFSLLTNGQKLQFIASLLFPYPEDAATLPLPKSLHGFYFVLRPFLWLWRKYRKIASTEIDKKRAGENHEKRIDRFL